MRAGIGARSKFGGRACYHRLVQASSRSRRRNRRPYPRGASTLSPRCLRLPVDGMGRHGEVDAWCRRGSSRVATPQHRSQPQLVHCAFPTRRWPSAARLAGSGASRRAGWTCARFKLHPSPAPVWRSERQSNLPRSMGAPLGGPAPRRGAGGVMSPLGLGCVKTRRRSIAVEEVIRPMPF